MEFIKQLLMQSKMFEGMADDEREFVAKCGVIEHYHPGQKLAATGKPADRFYLVRKGRVAIAINVPGRGDMLLQTLGAGEIVGWSWLFPPYKWTFDVNVIDETSVIAMDGACLRRKCEENKAMGYEMMKSFAGIMTERLAHTRMQLIDIYAHPEAVADKKK